MQDSPNADCPDAKNESYSVGLRIAIVLALLSCSVLFGTILWGLNRGFDFTDEGSCLLLYARPLEYMNLSSCQLLVSQIPKLCMNEVCHYRFLHLISRVIGAGVVSAGVCAWASVRLPQMKDNMRVLLFLLGLVSNFVAYAILPPIISYNSVTAFLLFIAAGLLFFASASKDASTNLDRKSDYLLIAIAGICIGLSVFVKISSAVLVLTAALLFLTLRKRFLLAWLSLLSGVAIGIGIYFGLFDKPVEWINRLSAMVGSEWRDGTHLPGRMARDYLLDVSKDLLRFCVIFLPLGLSIYLWRRNKSGPWIWKAAAIILSLGATAYAIRSEYFLKTDIFWAAGYMSVFTMLYCSRKHGVDVESIDKLQFFSGLVFLAVLPVLLSAGTDTGILWHSTSDICPWMLMSALCLVSCIRSLPKAIFVYAIFFLTFVPAYVTYHYVLRPYRVFSSLINETLPAPKGTKLEGLLVDPDTSAFVLRAKQAVDVANFQSGDPIMAFYELPGLVYALGGRSSGAPWFRYIMPNVACAGIKKLSSEPHQRLFLVLTSVPMEPKLADAFKSQGVMYPDDFTELAVIHDRDRGFWDLSNVRVYALKSQASSVQK